MTNLELFCSSALLKIFFKNINMNKRPLDSIPMIMWLFKGYEKRIGHLSMVMKTRGEAHIIFTLFLAAFLRSLQSLCQTTLSVKQGLAYLSHQKDPFCLKALNPSHTHYFPPIPSSAPSKGTAFHSPRPHRSPRIEIHLS